MATTVNVVARGGPCAGAASAAGVDREIAAQHVDGAGEGAAISGSRTGHDISGHWSIESPCSPSGDWNG